MKYCPVCQKQVDTEFICKQQFLKDTILDLIKCKECELIFVDPFPTQKQIDVYYNDSYFNFSFEKEMGKGWYFARNLKGEGNFLDFGCATGFFLKGIKEGSSWNVYGIEQSKKALEFARRNLRLDVRENLEKANFSESFFDFIHINNVLEHINNPIEIMIECKRILKNDGVIFLAVPNGEVDYKECLVYYKKYKKPPYNNNGHLLYFSRKSLKKLISTCGLIINSAFTTNFKRGLRAIGFFPKKLNWKKVYEFVPSVPEVKIHDEWKRPKIYHWFKHKKSKLFRIPGIHKFGLDLILFLKKSVE